MARFGRTESRVRSVALAVNPVVHDETLLAVAAHKGTPTFLVENHDEAYYLWRDAGVRQATLVHVDAHHDMWPIGEGGATTALPNENR